MSLPTTATWPVMAPPPPAYNAVPMRTTFSRPAPTGPPAATPDKPKKVVWSNNVKLYVQRALADEHQVDSISTEDVQRQLRETISYFAERSMQDSIDWATYPLPQEIIIAERLKSAPAPLGTANPVTGTTNSFTSSKRKSQDMDELQSSAKKSIPPWQKTNLADRVTFTTGHKDKRQKQEESTASKFDLEKRKQRFQLGTSGSKTAPPWSSPRNESDSETPAGPIVGTNQSLEKSYFRLTAPPKAETVRPQHVLERTLDMLRKKWRGEEKNYNYICNQFKSLRQDLTVQHIKNSFTVKVYEMHARIALEKGDLGEYNQCQTQLRVLYTQKLGGHPAEFLAYRILYFVYTCNKADMNDLLAELTPSDKTQEAVRHALDVRSALALGNYHKFFKLYLDAPNMGAYLMDMFVVRERLNALANISRAYISTALSFLTHELGFENDDETRSFLETHGAQHLLEETTIDKNAIQLRVNFKREPTLFERLRAAAFSKVDIKGQI